jgi:hypothetical protein
VDEGSIELKYLAYKKSYPNRVDDSDAQLNDSPTSEGKGQEQVSDSSSNNLTRSQESKQEKLTTSFWLNGKDIGAGWKYLDWFGYYLLPNSSSQWVYHADLGWVYLTEMSSSSIWMYHEKLGWAWTMPAFFPQSYILSKGNWVFLENKRYFDYANGSWLRP